MEPMNSDSRYEEGELHVIRVEVDENEIRLTGTVYPAAEHQCRSDAINGLLGASTFSILPASELCSRNLVAVTVTDENGKPRLCRAVITDTSEVPKGYVRVLLVDECRPDVQVRLSHLYYCPKHVSAVKYPPTCQQFVLADVLPAEGRFKEIEAWLKWKLLDKTVGSLFDLHVDGTSYICPLDEQKLPVAFSMLVEGLTKMIKNPLLSLSALSGKSHLKLEAKEMSVTPPRPAYSQWKMPLGFKEEAHVLSMEKGPWMFCLQFKRQKEQVPSIREKLKILHLTGKLQTGELNIGDAVICPNKFHGGHSRGLITNKLPDNVYSVYYVDEGSKALIKEREIWLLPEEMAKIPLLVHRCRLDGIVCTKDEDISKRFEVLVKDRILIGSLEKMGKDIETTANLYINENSVLDLLVYSYKKEILLDDCQVTISYVNEEKAIIFVVLSENAELLDKLHIAVQEALHVAPPLSFPEKMQSCIAVFPDDECWYRATILQTGNTFKVRYVDYGNEASLSKEALRTISQSLVEMAPAQALPCILNNVDMKSVKAADISKMTENDSLKVKVMRYTEVAGFGNVAVVELTTASSGISLNESIRDLTEEKDSNNNVDHNIGAFGIGLLLSRLKSRKDLHMSKNSESAPQHEEVMQQMLLQQRFSHPPPTQSYQRPLKQPYHYEHRERRPYQGRLHQLEQQYSRNTPPSLYHQYQQYNQPKNQLHTRPQRHFNEQHPYHLLSSQTVSTQTPCKEEMQEEGRLLLKRMRPEEGSLKFCRLTFEAGPSCFYLVQEESLEQIKAITQKLGDACKGSIPKCNAFNCGSFVALKDNDIWHRAQVTYTQGSIFKVFMMDVGKEKCVQLYELKPLPEVLAKFPAQAIKCCLQNTKTQILKAKPCKLRELMDVQMVVHFISCKDHLWQVNLFSQIHPEEIHCMNGKPIPTSSDDKNVNGAAASSEMNLIETSTNVKIPFGCVPANLDQDPCSNKALHSPLPSGTSEAQLASFSPVGIVGRSDPGPFTSTTHLDLASNSLSPSAIPMDDTVSSTDSRSTVRHNISVEQEELNSVKPFTKKAPLEESEKGSKVKPCVTCGTGVGSVLQYIAKQNADKVINAALATHAHSQARHDSETDTSTPQLASVKNLPLPSEYDIKAVGKQIIEDDVHNLQDAEKSKFEDESLLWDSSRGAIACKGENLDKDTQPKSLVTGGDADESLLWDSRIGVPTQKIVSGSNAAVPNESLVWDSKVGSNLNANNSKVQDDGKCLHDASESLLWDSRIGIPTQKVVSGTNAAVPNESLVWDSKIGSSLNANESKIQDDSKCVVDESLLWDSRRGRLGYATERKLNGCKNDVTIEESISEMESEDINYNTEPQPSSVETSVMPVKNTLKETIHLPPQEFQKLKLPLNTQVNVCVAYVNGLSVWVQLKEHLSDLNDMMDALNTQMEDSREGYDTNLSRGVPCISRYHLDEGWYRAVVMDVDESKKKVKVLYVDYGNAEQVDPEDIFVLPEKFQELPQQALHCCLPADFEDWLEPYQEKLEGLAGKCAIVSVAESHNEHVWTLSVLEVDGEDLIDLIKQSIPVAEVEKIEESQDIEVDLIIDYPAQKMPLVDGERVYVSYLVEEVEVWLQKVKDVPVITDVSTHIAESDTALLKIDKAKKNVPCLAQSAADGVWYRAMIMSLVEPDQFTVHFVDYGNSETVPIDQIREIPEGLVSITPLAYCCTLNDCNSSREIGWKALEREFVDQELVVHVKNSGGDKVVISLLLDEKDIVYDQVKAAQDEQEKEQELGEEKLQTVNTKSRNWYAPIGNGEVATTQSSSMSSNMLKSSPSSEVPECKDSSSVTPSKSGSSPQGLTGVFMSFRKTKDPIGLSKSGSPEGTSPILVEKGISSQERGPSIANRSPSCTKSNGYSPSKPSLFQTNNGIGLKPPSLGSTVCSSNNSCTPGNEPGSQLKEKQIEAEGSVTVSTGQKPAEESHKAHGKRFLDCIEEVEECNESSSDIQINSYTAYLVHIEESPFSLWVQKEEENDLAEYIETWYKEHNQERAEDLKVDDMCVTVLGESAQRVRVQCVEDANVTVFLIDQGKRTVVSKQDLYKLPESLMDIPPLAKQIYLPVKVVPGRESGAVIAVAEVAHQSKCLCIDLDGRYTIVWCPGAENLADYLVDNKLASPITWELGPMRRHIASAKRKLQEEAELLESQNRQERSFYQTADTDLAAKLEQSLKVLNAVTQAVD